MAFLALGIAVPAPAGVGGFHFAGRWCLENVFGIAAEQATAAVLVLHATAVLPTILVGGLVALREGLSFGELMPRTGSGTRKGHHPAVATSATANEESP